jgi:hypothetical protein
MSSESKARRRRIRYRPGYARPERGPRVAGGTATDVIDYDVIIQIPENPPVTEIEARAVELLLGSDALRDLLTLSKETPRRIRRE